MILLPVSHPLIPLQRLSTQLKRALPRTFDFVVKKMSDSNNTTSKRSSRSSAKSAAASASTIKPSSGVMMILSPAKTLDLSPYNGSFKSSSLLTSPSCDAAKTRRVAGALKSRSQKELTKLLNVSANLGQTAYDYWKNFQVDENIDVDKDDSRSKPCIYAFSGIAYQGLQIHECNDEAVLYLQDNLRIIDPLYGSLRPLDKIQPYRLEMATKGVFQGASGNGDDDDDGTDKKTKLNAFWSESVTASLAKDLAKRSSCKIVLNVASDEYSSAVNPNGLPAGTKYVKIIFHDDGRVVTVHAKRARGLMTRFVAEHACQTLDDVKQFNYEGYAFCESKSDDLTLVFDRTKKQQQFFLAQKRKNAANANGRASETKKTKN